MIKIIKKIVFLAFIAILIIPINNVSADNNSYDNRMLEINNMLDAYEREDAYYSLLELKEQMDVENGDRYLEVLSLIIQLERYHMQLGEMATSAVELYEASIEHEDTHYQMEALNVLAFVEYYNYDTVASMELLSEMALLDGFLESTYFTTQYYIGAARLKAFEEDFDGAIVLLDHALNNLEGPLVSEIKVDLVSYIFYLMSDNYYEMGNIDQSINYLNKAIERIVQEDIELRVEYNYFLALSLVADGRIEDARQLYGPMMKEYENTSDLYKNYAVLSDFLWIEADILYFEGQYQQAADLYAELAVWDVNYDTWESYAISQEAIDDFDSLKVDEQISLFERLRDSQSRLINLYKIGITILVLLLFVILMGAYLLLNQKNKLQQLSYTDHLTNISNRRFIIEMLESVELGSKCTALIDLDHFKQINDNYGHSVGDLVLKRVVNTIQDTIGSNDYLGRYGGEEFLLILDTDCIDTAVSIVEKICEQVSILEWDVAGLNVTVSIGLVYSRVLDGDKLLQAADQQLYKAKNSGRNQFKYDTIN